MGQRFYAPFGSDFGCRSTRVSGTSDLHLLPMAAAHSGHARRPPPCSDTSVRGPIHFSLSNTHALRPRTGATKGRLCSVPAWRLVFGSRPAVAIPHQDRPARTFPPSAHASHITPVHSCFINSCTFLLQLTALFGSALLLHSL